MVRLGCSLAFLIWSALNVLVSMEEQEVSLPDDTDFSRELTELPIPNTYDTVIDWSSSVASVANESVHDIEDDEEEEEEAEPEFVSQLKSSWSEDNLRDDRLNSIWLKELREASSYRRPSLLLPWERSNQLRSSFLQSSLHVPRHPIQASDAVQAGSTTDSTPASSHLHSDPTWWAVKHRISSIDWQADLDHKRRLAFERCRVLLQLDPSKSELGRLILSDVHTLASDDAIQSSIVNVFANKATKTILKRSCAFQNYVAWCTHRKIKPYPVLESTAYMYLNDMSHKSASFASSFKESLNFMHGTLGIDGCKQAAESRRIVGICMNRALNKRPRVQAPPLTVYQVSFMEEFVCSNADKVDRCFVGHCLLCVYTRARWNDLQHACEPNVDFEQNEGFFELSSLITKTSTGVAKKTTFLPMVAPVPGITEFHWLATYLALRKELGLPEFNKNEPSFPLILTSGKFGKLPLTSSQAGEWIRSILDQNNVGRSFVRVTSHSFKATCLSWCAKGGLSQADRCILGYHVSNSNQSMLHYSRDEQASPLRGLKNIIKLIKEGVFKPDNTRSGYFVGPREVNPNFAAPTPKVRASPNLSGPSNSRTSGGEESIKSDTDTSSSESESSHVMSDEELVAKQLDVPVRLKKRPRVDSSAWFGVHSRWRTVHLLLDQAHDKFKCGRKLTTTYRVVPELPKFDYHRCIDCFGHYV